MRRKHLTDKTSRVSGGGVAKEVKRRICLLAFMLVLIAGIFIAVAGTSFAYLTLSTQTASNPFASQKVEVVIIENDEVVTTPMREVVLGSTSKKVEFSNPAGAPDIVLRATFSPQIVSSLSSETHTIYEFFDSGAMTAPVDNQVTLGNVTLHFADGWNNSSNGWFYKDGFFYYNHILAAGETTPPLLAGVTCNLVDIKLEVLVSVEALQAHPVQAMDVWGVSIS